MRDRQTGKIECVIENFGQNMEIRAQCEKDIDKSNEDTGVKKREESAGARVQVDGCPMETRSFWMSASSWQKESTTTPLPFDVIVSFFTRTLDTDSS